MTRPRLARLRVALHAYRQLGPRRGTATAARRTMRIARGRLRAVELGRRPLCVSEHELHVALGEADPLTGLAAAGDAIPSLRRWRAELSEMSAAAQSDLLLRADDVVAHRFNLLGSGPTELGWPINWQRDLKSGRVWPVVHITRLRIAYPDSSDIKVPWELSRFQHLPLLAAANLISGDRRYLEELGAQLSDWISANPVEFGVNWASTMEVAIRAVNWVAALVLAAPAVAGEPWFEDALASLLLHGRFIHSHLDYESSRGNHYLSHIVGLLIVAGVFSASREGGEWAVWAARELGKEMRHQVRHDGCDHEASTSYHRLVTELFIVGADAAEALAPGALDPSVRAGIRRMLGFVADYTRPDGLAPQLGDADDGRLLPLGDYGVADQRAHLHLFRQAGRVYQPATLSAAYRDGGFFILRSGDLYAAVHCGDVGMYGRGAHAHNDLTAFELCVGTTPLIVDPGTYVYTADPAARNQFRSTTNHSALQIDGAEQNELREDRLFAMVDRARATLVSWHADPDVTVFVGRHRGFEALPVPATHTRTLRLDGSSGTLEILDEVISDGPHELSWCFPLVPCSVEVGPDEVFAGFGGRTLRIEHDRLSATVEQGWLSPAYGLRMRAPVVRLRGHSSPGVHRTAITLRIQS